MSVRSTRFDLGVDDLATPTDLAAMAGSWAVAGAPVGRARIFESVPALPSQLGTWAAALELPGLDCSALGRH